MDPIEAFLFLLSLSASVILLCGLPVFVVIALEKLEASGG